MCKLVRFLWSCLFEDDELGLLLIIKYVGLLFSSSFLFFQLNFVHELQE